MRSIKKAANGKSEQFEDELRSYVFLKICEMDDSRLIQLDYNEELIPFVTGIIENQKRFKGGGVNSSIDYVPNRVNNEVKLASGDAYLMDFLKDSNPISDTIDIHAALDKLNWQEKQVIDLYIRKGSIKEICDGTGYREKYIVKILNGARKKIKNDLR